MREFVKQFIANKPMAEAVKQELLNEFLKEDSRTVYELAGEKIAINRLLKAFRNLEGLLVEREPVKKETSHI